MNNATAIGFAVAIAAFIVTPIAAADPKDLRLACVGSIDDTTTSAGLFGPTKTHQQIPDQVDVEIVGGAGRARLPRKLLPMFGRARDGWAEIIDLQVGSEEISGAVNLNAQTKPKLRIDRNSGSIAVEGILGRFFGACKAIEASARAF